MLKANKSASLLFKGADGVISFIESSTIPIGLASLALRTLADSYKVEATDLYLLAATKAYEAFKNQASTSVKDSLPEIPKKAFEDALKHQKISVVDLDNANEKLRALLTDYGLDIYQQDSVLSKTSEIFTEKLSNEPDLLNPMLLELVKQMREELGQQANDLDKLKTRLDSEEGTRAKFQDEVSRLETKLVTQAQGLVQDTKDEIEAFLEDMLLAKAVAHSDYSLDKITPEQLLQRAFVEPLLKFPIRQFDKDWDLPSMLLNSEYEVVPFYGRDAEIRELTDWCASSERFALRFYRGAGGRGKTRLARELIRRQQTKGWQTGFLNVEAANNSFADWQSLFASATPVLLVVDYAETKRSELKLILAKVREYAKASTVQIRIILLARTDVQWWEELRTSVGLTKLPKEATELARVSEEAIESYKRALTAFASHLDKDIAEFTLPADSQLISKSDSVLFLHMQALLNVVGKAEQGLVSSDSDDEELEILDGVLSLEQDTWLKEAIQGLSQDNQKAIFAELMTVITLGVSTKDLSEVVTIIDELPTVNREQINIREPIAKRCIQLYKNSERLIDALRPDILGEHLIEQTLLSEIEDPDKRRQLFKVVYDHNLSNEDEALAVLVRLSQRHGESGVKLLRESLHGRWEHLVFKANEVMPWETIYLRKLTLEIAEYCLEAVTDKQQKAKFMATISYRLFQLGQYDNALKMIEEASYIHQQLCEENPNSLKLSLVRASGLNHLGTIHNSLKQPNKALQAFEQSVNINRRFIAEQPDVCAPILASSLINMGIAHISLGNLEQALEVTKRALTIYQHLSQEQPSVYLLDVAASLENLGSIYRILNQHERALEVSEQSLEIFRELVDKQPDSYLPNLAQSYVNLASILSNLGQVNEASNLIKQGIIIYKQLSADYFDSFAPALAIALNNLATMYIVRGQQNKALRFCQESLAIYQKLTATGHENIAPDLAMLLSNFAKVFHALGSLNKALEAVEKAIDIYQSLIQEQPDTYLPDLAKTFENYGNILGDLELREPALLATQTAVEIFDKLTKKQPKIFLSDLGRSYNNLGRMFSALGKREEALISTEVAINATKFFFLENPKSFQHQMETIIKNYYRNCEILGKEPNLDLISDIQVKLKELQQ